jgi:hypothetical protein
LACRKRDASIPVEKICVVSITEPAGFTSDTASNFALPSEKTNTFKITAPDAKTVNLTAGTDNVFKVLSTKKSGDDFYFTIAAYGASAKSKSSGVYFSVDGQTPPKKICVVTLAA